MEGDDMCPVLASPRLVPAVLLTIAMMQVGFARAGTLADWKGGGFGMFATLDRPDNRFLRVTATDRAGQTYLVRVPYGRFPSIPALASAHAARTVAFPTDVRLRAIAEAVLRSHVVGSSGERGRLPARLSHSPFGPVLAQALTLSAIDVLAPSRAGASPDITEVQAEVIGLRFDPRRHVLAFTAVGASASARLGLD
jgi:hypothetical protein